jgi:hypothetical protein
LTQYQVRPGATLVDGLPASDKPWKLTTLGHETIIAQAEGHGTYLIANGKAEKITPLPGPLEPVMIEQKLIAAVDADDWRAELW